MKRQQPPSSTSSTGSRPQKLPRVEYDSLRLTDPQHEEMDVRILNHIPDIKPAGFAPFAPSLLNLIVFEAHGLLNEYYINIGHARTLIDSNPQLVDELEAAFNERKFARIRLLSE
jgi:hypothetical protein